MAAVFRNLELSWGGEAVSVKPTMELLNRIEQKVSLSAVAYRAMRGEPPLSHIAFIVGTFLREGGVSVTDESVYGELCNGTSADIQQVTEAVILAAFPHLGKPEAQPTHEPEAPKPRARRKSTK